MADSAEVRGERYPKSLYELDGFDELVGILVPFFLPRERARVLAECAGPRGADLLHALAVLSGESEERDLELDLGLRAGSGAPLEGGKVEALATIRAHRQALELLTRWVHALWVFAAGCGNVLYVDKLNEAILPTLTPFSLALFGRSEIMRTAISGPGDEFHEFVDLTLYDGVRREALALVRKELPVGEAVPEALRRLLADSRPSIAVHG